MNTERLSNQFPSFQGQNLPSSISSANESHVAAPVQVPIPVEKLQPEVKKVEVAPN